MKIQIRKNVFETNSSTCHTLVIPKREMIESEWPISEYNINGFGSHYTFGRGLLEMLDDINGKLSYAFMLICYYEQHKGHCAKKDKPDMISEINKWKDLILGWISERASSENVVKTASDLLDWLRDMIIYDKSGITGFGKYAWIEHAEEMYRFVDAFYKDTGLLKKFLFDVDAYATVCGDEYRGAYLKRVGFELDYYEINSHNDDYSGSTWENKIEEVKKDFIVY